MWVCWFVPKHEDPYTNRFSTGTLTYCLPNAGRIVTEVIFFSFFFLEVQANILLKGYNPSFLNSFPFLIVAPLGLS